MLACATAAHAEKADRDKPINVDSERLSLDSLNNIRILEGSVVLTQGTMLINAERVEIRTGKDNAITAFATGNPVKFRQKREGCEDYVEAVAERAEYDDSSGILKLISKARLKSGEDELIGELIVYNSETDNFQALGNRPDAVKGDGRVRMVIQPKNQTGKKDPCGAKAAQGGAAQRPARP
jgi:lipopolysaccharide export system protein LptA